jgi:hypothetical protein
LARRTGDAKDRDLSWQDWTIPNDTDDGRKAHAIHEAGEAGGGDYAVFIRDTNGGSAVRLGQGTGVALSPDGQWALVLRQNLSPPDFVLLPTGVGQQRPFPTGNVTSNGGEFLPDFKRILLDGHEAGHASRVYIMNVDGDSLAP